MRFNIVAVSIFMLISLSSYSIELIEVSFWESDSKYNVGDIINYKNDIYIALLPSKGMEPKKSIFWRIVRLDNAKKFKIAKLNLIGDVVVQDEKIFVAKCISVSRRPSDLDSKDKWMQIIDSTDGYELPSCKEEDALSILVGVDNNANGIRDDFETDVILSDLPKTVKENALNSGKAYGKIFAVGVTERDITRQDAINAIQLMIYAKQCRRASKAINGGRGWRETDFYNTLDRIEAKFKIQNALHEIVGDEYKFDTNNSEPCIMLNNI